MAEILSSSIVLKLNGNWQRIGWATVADAFTQMMSGDKNNPPALGMDIEYPRDEEGMPDTTQALSMREVLWEEWLSLPVRKGDMSIRTSKLILRVPTVIICPNFRHMPKKTFRPNLRAIRKRDGDRCQYTGKLLTNQTASIDHIVPKSKGGQNTWENLVLAHRDINSKKGNRLNHEVGLRLLKQPTAPRSIPLCEYYNEVRHPDHCFF